MKIENKKILLTSILLIITLFKVNSQYLNKQYLLGTWLVDYETSISHIDSKYNNPKSNIKTHLNESYKGRVLHFMKDGSYMIQTSKRMIANTKWKIEKDNILLIITPNGEKRKYYIKTLTKNLLTLESLEDKKPILNPVYFKKIK